MATIINEGKTSPANAEPAKAERTRIPMSVPQRKLEVPEIEGFHQHWFLENRVPRALQGGYIFVDPQETSINQLGIGADGMSDQNADLGNRVMVVAGTGLDGKPEHLVLMKIREEWWQEDQKALEAVNKRVIDAIHRRQKPRAEGESVEDQAKRYVGTAELQTHTKTSRRS